MANKKALSVLSTAAIGTLIASAVGSTALAKVDGLVVKNAEGTYLNYSLEELKASVINDALGAEGAELYKDFDAARTAGSLVSYHDDKVGFVDAEAVNTAAMDAALEGKDFALDTFTESAKETVLPAAVYQAKVTDGKVVKGDEVKPTSAANQEISVSAIGAKKLQVKFDQAVDTTKALVEVKKGSVAVSTDKIEFSEDKKSVVITTTTNLTKGDYVVTVSGLTETALTSTATVADVKVSKIAITSETAPVLANKKDATVKYEVLNQYNERMTGQSVNWTISTGVAASADSNLTGYGSFVITAAAGLDFIPGATVYITGVHAASGTVVNEEVKIGLEAKADAVTFKGVYNTTTSKIESLPAAFTNGKYVLLFEVNDQYGNKMANPSHSDLVFTSNNPLFVSGDTSNGAYATATDVTIGDVTYEAVDLLAGTMVAKGGSVTVQAISKSTGKTSTYTIEAEAAAAVKSFAMSAPDKIVAEGEKVEIPFTAIDQYGNAVTKYSSLATGNPIQLTVGSGGTLAFEQQNDGTAKLYYTAPANANASATIDAPIYLSSLVTDGGNFSSLMINVKDTAVPTAIVGIDKEKATSIAQGNYVEILGKDLIIQDQYGRVIKDADVETWLGAATNANRIVVTSEMPVGDKSPLTVKTTGNLAANPLDAVTQQIDVKTDKFTIAAKTGLGLNSTEKLVFALSTDSGVNTIASSAKSITFTKVDQSAYESYEVADLGTIYNDTSTGAPATDLTNSNFDKTVKVYGVKADGTKVLLPASDYTVAVTSGKLTTAGNVIKDVNAAGYVANDFKDAALNYKDNKATILVTVNDANGAAAAVLEKELLVSNKTPEVKTVAFDTDLVTDGKASIKGDAVTNAKLNAVIDTTKVKDQYDVVKAEAPVITITKLVKVEGSSLTVVANGTAGASIVGAKMGDKFTATYKYAGGTSVSVDFTVGLDDTAPSVQTVLGSGAPVTIASGATATITFTESLSSVGKTAVETALNAASTNDGTYTWNSNNTVITITGHANSTVYTGADVSAVLTDLTGNASATLVIVDAN